ncbi:ACT domain-containing protein [Streptomyces sp. HUAS TT7]|uniref:ACT domain-containing protein n=1 Tax=Streptomyces sp. HUAS TT7 TaxID=3447507 RepID=UPI003F65CDDB
MEECARPAVVHAATVPGARPQEQADAAAPTYDYVVGRITLSAQSAIEAVGLTAAVATDPAAHGISCNVVAGYHHDLLFVPYERAEEAVEVLNDLSLHAS